MNNRLKFFFSLFLISLISAVGNSFAATSTAVCQVDSETGSLTGNFGSPTRTDYDLSCIFTLGKSNKPGQKSIPIVPVGNSKTNFGPRVVLKPATGSADSENVTVQLYGADDNTLSRGRGRIEVSDCFISNADFHRLSPQEQQFRIRAHAVYEGCRGELGRQQDRGFEFRLRVYNESPNDNWDAIIAQWHNIPQSDLYKLDGQVHTLTERTVAAYEEKIKAGADFEEGIQPPLSFKIKEGKFLIIANSSLQQFSPKGGNCHVGNNAEVGITKECGQGKTATLLYRSAVSEVFTPGKSTNFSVETHWPASAGEAGKVKVVATNNNVTKTLVNWSGRIGTLDAGIYPYFKAGIYRHNMNGTHTKVRIVDLVTYNPKNN